MKIGLFIFPVRFANLPPIDIAYLSAYLKSRGHEVYIRDFNVEWPVSNDCDGAFWKQERNQQDLFNRDLRKIESWVKDILDFHPDFIGLSVWSSQIYFSLEIAKMIKSKRKETKVIFGGPWITLTERGIHIISESNYVDYIVFGEGEATLADIIESGNFKGLIPSCLRKINGNILDGGWRKGIKELNSIPFPDYDNFNFNKYLFSAYYPILFNRGCNWNCSFCCKSAIWKGFRSRGVENIASEIQLCLSKYPSIRRFYSCDHSMNSNMSLLYKLCNLIIERDIKNIEFLGFGQVNSGMMDEQFLKKLKKAGFVQWGIGIQTGSDRILRSMRRPHTALEAEIMLKRMHNQGMSLSIDFIVGYPEETEDDFKQTLEFASRVGRYVTNISVAPECNIFMSDLEFNFEKYGIRFPNYERNLWESANTTPKIRSERYKIMLDHLTSLGISHRYSDSDRKFFSQNLGK